MFDLFYLGGGKCLLYMSGVWRLCYTLHWSHQSTRAWDCALAYHDDRRRRRNEAMQPMKCVEATSAKGDALGVIPDLPVGHLPTVCTFVCTLHTLVLRPTWEFWLMFQKGRAFRICPWHIKFFRTVCFYNLVYFRPDAIIRLLSWFAVSILINTEQKGRFYQCGAIKPPWPCSSETFTVVYPSEWGWRRENNKLKPPPCINYEKDSFSTCVSGSH